MSRRRAPSIVGSVQQDATVPQSAAAAALAAAERSGVVVRNLHELPDLHAVVALINDIWHPDPANPLLTIEQLRAMTHAGNYLAGAFDGGSLVAACVGFFAAPPGVGLHSHIAGVSDAARGRSVGFALKLHQRAWALERELSEITWTFDPLVRRNAYFNVFKLGARPREYLVDFYGDIGDAINAGQGSDRLLLAWQLTAPHVVAACAGAEPADRPRKREPVAALAETASGRPQAAPRSSWSRAPMVRVQVPEDIERLRGSDPTSAREWRLAVRDVLGDLLADGMQVTGFSRYGHYIVERTTA